MKNSKRKTPRFSRLWAVLIPALSIISLAQGEEVTVRIDLETTFELKRNLWGVNNNNLFVPYTYRDEIFAKEAAPLRFSLIRFPGGSEANAYEWETGSFASWYYKSKIEPASALFPKSMTFDEKGVVKNENILKVDDFIDYCLREKKRPLVVLNLLTGAPRAIALLRRFEERGLPVSFAEMGNELYYLGYEKWTGDVAESVKKFTRFYESVKKEFPNLVISLPVGGNHRGGADVSGNARSDSAEGGLSPEMKRQVDWNEAFKNNPSYDAVSVHHYLSYFLTKKDLDGMNERLRSGKDLEAVYDYLGAESTWSESELAGLFSSFYPGKKMLLTEWGVLNAWDPALFQSWAHALFAFDFLQNLIRSKNGWEAACYHILTGRIFELFSHPLVTEGNTKKWDTSKMIRRMPYHPLALIGEVLEDSSQGLRLAVNGSPERSGALHYGARKWPLVNITGFKSKDGRSANLLVVNRDERAHTVKIEGIPKISMLKVKGFTSDKLSDSYGGANLGAAFPENGVLKNFEKAVEGARSFDVPKYFAGMVRVEFEK